MNLQEIYNSTHSKPIISFEVFPPKNGNEQLLNELSILEKFNPAMISVTSSSSVSNPQQNEIVTLLHEKFLFNVMPHITCVRNNQQDIKTYLNNLQYAKCILALRGDIPENGICHDFKYANELVKFIKKQSNISVAVAGYPEGHIESPSLETDIENLKKKIDAGADVIFTQLFFDPDVFFRYVEKVRAAGIETPIIPGIMPIMSYKQISRMTSLANISIPQLLAENIERCKEDNLALTEFGIEFCTKICRKLLSQGVEAMHFYTLNKAHATAKILENIL